MLTINHIDELRAVVSGKEEIRESRICTNAISFCYMIGGANTFDSDHARECRGIVFSAETGAVIGRPFHKFFNLGEREETQPHVVDWSKVVRVMDKRDGSMIHSVNDNGTIRIKTKKSFNSDVAVSVQTWLAGDSVEASNVRKMLNHEQFKYKTVIFEWTSPQDRIVLAYDKPSLVLLHVRDNVTGQYMNLQDLHVLSTYYNVPLVDEVDEFFETVEINEMDSVPRRRFSIKKMIEAAATREGVEGWIVQLESGEMIKVKTEWYLARHKVMTFLRERDIAELVMNEQVDDFKSLLSSKGVDITEVLEIEERVLQFFRDLFNEVEAAVDGSVGLTAREMAEKFKEHALRGLIMNKFNGKVPRYLEYFERNILKSEFSLRTLILKDVNGHEVEN
jgi:RNA ligase